MTQVTITVNVQQGVQTVRSVNGMLVRVGRRKIENLGLRIVQRMRNRGKKITYPVQWDSDKQRRAFFATDGFGRGIPTKRTNQYVHGWRLVQAKRGAWRIENRTKAAKYIGGNAKGEYQSRIHHGRWQLLKSAIEKELAKLPDDIRAEVIRASRSLKGVTIK